MYIDPPDAVVNVKITLIGSFEIQAFADFQKYLEAARKEANALEIAKSQQGAQGVQSVRCGEATAPAFATPPQTQQTEDPPARTAEQEQPSGPAAEPSDDTLQQSIRALIASKGINAAVALLGEFGVKRVSELKPEQKAEFVRKAAA